MDLADWDLLAVVRSCTSTATTTTTTATSSPTPTGAASATITAGLSAADLQIHHQHQMTPPPPPLSRPPQLPDLAYGSRFSSLGCGELQDIYKPFCPNLRFSPISSPSTSTSPPLPIVGGGEASLIAEHMKPQQLKQPQQLQQQKQMQQPVFHQHPQQQVKPSQFIFGTTSSVSTATMATNYPGSTFSISSIITSQSQTNNIALSAPTTSATTSHGPQKTKKRKNLQKKVFHVPAEGLSSDMWAWRKYGQKPIKGSPYPRGYYRCSSSKGCLARKQVERNRSDPKMYIVTYTGEHNHPMPTHRNSLAGSTRQKPSISADAAAAAAAASPSTTSTGGDQPGCSSSPTASVSLSPTPTTATNMAEKLTEPKKECDGEEFEEEEDLGMKDSGEGNEMGFSDMVLNDDFYVGFGDLDDDVDAADGLFDKLSASSMEKELPWLANGGSSSSAAATAAGGR